MVFTAVEDGVAHEQEQKREWRRSPVVSMVNPSVFCRILPAPRLARGHKPLPDSPYKKMHASKQSLRQYHNDTPGEMTLGSDQFPILAISHFYYTATSIVFALARGSFFWVRQV